MTFRIVVRPRSRCRFLIAWPRKFCLLASAIVGGAASMLGGGKFANGAITGAFAYAATEKYDSDGNPARAQYADNSGTCDIPNCGNGPVEAVTVTASHTYYLNLNLEFSLVFGVAFNAGIYYNHDFLAKGKSPIGLYFNKSQTFGVAIGASTQFGRMSGPFSTFAGSTGGSYNFGAGPVSGSLTVDEAGHITRESIGPGTGLKYGLSVSGGPTWTTPLRASR